MQDYKPVLDLLETEIAIKYIKDFFEKQLARALKLTRVSAPLFVYPETGLNDNLNGYERTVRFEVKSVGREVEIVQSLAKWKRSALKKYGFQAGAGLYTDMNAIRRDEDLDCLHSVYVDQWDWEKIILTEQRTVAYLRSTVRQIYGVIKKTAAAVTKRYPELCFDLPKNIVFITSDELEKRYPDKSRKQREYTAVKEYGAVFVHRIGWDLSDGAPHDGRAADYDDWNLNGDILLYNDVIDCAYEISSMGIRVNAKSLTAQIEKRGETDKLNNPYCQSVLSGELPQTIGGGIGQSRLCMFFLKKAHIGEVQSSVWNDVDAKNLEDEGIKLL